MVHPRLHALLPPVDPQHECELAVLIHGASGHDLLLGSQAHWRRPRSSFSGVSGKSWMRTPVARKMALPMAGMTGGREVSPRPWISLASRCSRMATLVGGRSRRLVIM